MKTEIWKQFFQKNPVQPPNGVLPISTWELVQWGLQSTLGNIYLKIDTFCHNRSDHMQWVNVFTGYLYWKNDQKFVSFSTTRENWNSLEQLGGSERGGEVTTLQLGLSWKKDKRTAWLHFKHLWRFKAIMKKCLACSYLCEKSIKSNLKIPS